jgi:lipopolysaccharide transport system permease protein
MSSVGLPAGPALGRTVQVIGHLTAREFRIRYQSAFLGWLWALLPAVVRFIVLGVVFSQILPATGPDYLAELAVGVLGWQWFSAGVASATVSPISRRDLLSQPALPRPVIPVVSVLTDAFDYLAGVPVLLVIVLVDTGGLPVTALLFPLLLMLQGCLILGLGMAAAVANVHFRDTALAVSLLLAVGIYATPVFYTSRVLTEQLRSLTQLNPVGALLEAQRQVLIEGTVPSATTLAVLTVVCGGVLAAGWAVYRHWSATFVDQL